MELTALIYKTIVIGLPLVLVVVVVAMGALVYWAIKRSRRS